MSYSLIQYMAVDLQVSDIREYQNDSEIDLKGNVYVVTERLVSSLAVKLHDFG